MLPVPELILFQIRRHVGRHACRARNLGGGEQFLLLDRRAKPCINQDLCRRHRHQTGELFGLATSGPARICRGGSIAVTRRDCSPCAEDTLPQLRVEVPLHLQVSRQVSPCSKPDSAQDTGAADIYIYIYIYIYICLIYIYIYIHTYIYIIYTHTYTLYNYVRIHIYIYTHIHMTSSGVPHLLRKYLQSLRSRAVI